MSKFPIILSIFAVLCLVGCQSTSSKTHRTGGVAPYVSVKAYWTDDNDKKHLVGGLNCVLLAKGSDAGIGKKSVADNALKFENVTPGDYLVKVSTPNGQYFEEAITLPERRRVTVRFNLEAKKAAEAIKGAGTDTADALKVAGEGTAYILLEGTKIILQVAFIALGSIDKGSKKKDRSSYRDDSRVSSKQVIKESKRIERRFRRLKKKL